MKQCNVPFEIKLLNTKAASEMARHHNLHRFERRLFFQKGVKKTDIDIHKIRPELPRLDVTFIPLFLQTVSLFKIVHHFVSNANLDFNISIFLDH